MPQPFIAPNGTITSSPSFIFIAVSMITSVSWFYLMSLYPWLISSDDALNFVRGVERFSVLELRPHFPGYPGMVAGAHLCKFITSVSAEKSVILFSLIGAALIPILCGFLVLNLSKSLLAAIATSILIYASPLLAGVGLSGLSDAPASAFLLAAIYAGIKQRFALSGLLLALMLATRPAYIVLAIAFIPFLFIRTNKTHSIKKAFIYAFTPLVIVGLLCTLFLLSKDGTAYFAEGVRFTQGHFEIWGNTYSINQHPIISWYEKLSDALSLPLLVGLLISIVFALIQSSHTIRIVGIVAGAYLIAIVFSQNPDNLRHFVPVFFIGSALGMTMAASRIKQSGTLLAITILLLVSYLPRWELTSDRSPETQAINYLQALDSAQRKKANTIVNVSTSENYPTPILGTNYAVNLMRLKLDKYAIYDLYYPSHIQLLSNKPNTENIWRLSGTPLSENAGYSLEATFLARFPTERALYLYRM